MVPASRRVVLVSTGIVRVPPVAGGAIESYVCDLARILRRANTPVTLVAPVRSRSAFAGVDLVEVPAAFDSFPLKAPASALAHLLGGVASARRTRWHLDRLGSEGPPVVHLNEEISAMMIAQRLTRVPTVFTLHNPPGLDGSPATGAMDGVLRFLGAVSTRRMICTRVDRIIVLSSYFRDFMVQEWDVSPERVRVLPLPIDTETFVPAPTPHERLELLYVGRFDRRKNVLAAVHAMTSVDPQVRLTLVGDGPLLPTVRSFVHERGLIDRVRILSHLTTPQLVKVYQGCDLFVFPSALETYGRVVVEAAACGLPTVLPDAPIFRDFIRAGFAEPVLQADAEGLSRAIEGMRASPARRAAMGEAARRYACENSGYDRFGPRLMSIYDEARA